MAENIPNLKKDTNIHIQESQWTPRRINEKEIHAKRYYQTAESQRQRENLKASIKK